MKQSEIIYQLLTSSDNFNYLTEMLEGVMQTAGIVKPNKEIEALLKSGLNDNEIELNLDETINAFVADVTMAAFQAGIDYALCLLGHDEVFNLLPARETKKDIQA